MSWMNEDGDVAMAPSVNEQASCYPVCVTATAYFKIQECISVNMLCHTTGGPIVRLPIYMLVLGVG